MAKKQYNQIIYCAFLCFSLIISNKVFGQEEFVSSRFKELKRDNFSVISLDKITNDTLIHSLKNEQKVYKSYDNIELSRGSLLGGMGTKCGCEALPNGIWTRRYRNGTLKEVGEYSCGQKSGTWTYYFDNGNINKIETYQLPYLEIMAEEGQIWDSLMNKQYLLTGAYSEYYLNGRPKIEGRYEIIEQHIDSIITTDKETYEQIKTPSKVGTWIPISVKTDIWKIYNEQGNLTKIEEIRPVWYDNKKYRSLRDRYYDLIFEKRK